MAKKKKKKFKKKHFRTAVPTQNSPIETTEHKDDVVESAPSHKAEEEKSDEYNYIRKDVRNVLIIMAIMLVIIIVAYIIDKNTTWFSSLSDWMFKITNIQIN